MTCPPKVAQIVVEIIKTGVLRIRQAAWSGEPQLCAIEADHIHNLPDLLNHYSPELLKFYWEVEKPAFISQSNPAHLAPFEPLWSNLARYTRDQAEPVAPAGQDA